LQSWEWGAWDQVLRAFPFARLIRIKAPECGAGKLSL
jgi:hypothetical protein